jgi:uncharacterized protein (TIGR00369 family)
MSEKLDRLKDLKIRENFPFYQFPSYLGMEIKQLEYGIASLHLSHKPELTQGDGLIHGGAITSLCDTSAGVALFTMTDEGEKIVTIELKVNFIAPADSDLTCSAKILHKGRKTAVGEAEVTNPKGELIAKSLITYYIYKE